MSSPFLLPSISLPPLLVHTCRDQFPDILGYVQPIQPLILSQDNVQVRVELAITILLLFYFFSFDLSLDAPPLSFPPSLPPSPPPSLPLPLPLSLSPSLPPSLSPSLPPSPPPSLPLPLPPSLPQVNLWVGREGIVTHTHYDCTYNFFVQNLRTYTPYNRYYSSEKSITTSSS